MNKKILSVLIIAIFMLTSINLVTAQDQTRSTQTQNIGAEFFGDDGSGGLIGGIVNGIMNFMESMLNREMMNPVTGEKVNFLMAIAAFMFIFCIIAPASGLIPVFKHHEHKKFKNMFAVSISILIIFFAPITTYLEQALSYLGILAQIGIIIILILAVYWMVAKGSKAGANIGRMGVEAAQIRTENKKALNENKKAKKLENMEMAEINQIGRLTKIELQEIKNQIPRWRVIKNELSSIHNIQSEPGSQIAQRVLAQLSGMINEETKEVKINQRLEALTRQLKTIGHKEIKDLKHENVEIKDAISLLKSRGVTKQEQAKKELHTAINVAKRIYILEDELLKEISKNGEFESEVKKVTQNIITNLSNGNLQTAIEEINLAIREVEKEAALEKRMIAIEKEIYNLLTKENKELLEIMGRVKLKVP